MNVEIVKFDNLGRGICYVNNKIMFVPKSVPGDIVKVKIVKDSSKYYEGKIESIITPSKKRIEESCPFYFNCGGCDLMHISKSDRLDYLLLRVNDILKSNKIDYEVKDIIKSENSYNYRNKITLKINNKKIGLYENDTHDLIEIDKCLIVNDNINSIIKDIHKLNINNGEIIIRSNYKNELLIIIYSEDKVDNINYLVDNYLIAGIVLNNKCIYGENFFLDRVNNYVFKVSYDSFFQVNPYICSLLFKLIDEYTKDRNNVLDLYCGVGTLSIVASENAKNVLGVEIVENAIKDSEFNAMLNNKNNVSFVCEDAKKVIDKITSSFDTIIFDPPRGGVDKSIIDKVKEVKIERIIYVSCNPSSLGRDLSLLTDTYNMENIKLLDMFPNTHHIETICILERK